MSDGSLLEAAARAVLATLDEGVVIQAVDRSIVFCNGAAEQILGLTSDQLCGRAAIDSEWRASKADGSDWPPDEFPITRAIRDGHHTERATMYVHCAGGGLCSISVSAHPIVLDDQIVAAVATFRDVTADHVAASQASDNERQLLDALHASGVAIATSDRHGNLLSANEAFAEIVGRSSAQLAGMHFTEFSGPDAFEDQLAAVERLREGKEDQFHAFKSYSRPDGTLRYALMNLLVLRDQAGAVRRHVSLVQDVTEQLHQEAVLTAEARTDSLTGLLNRRGVLATLDAVLPCDADRPLLVAFMDLDRFKGVNDRYGHEIGDQVLTRVAAAMQGAVRNTDVLGRLGGDEFVVVYMDAPFSSGSRLADALRAAVESVPIPGDSVPLRASVGIVAPELGETAAGILRRADAAMYALKRASRATPARDQAIRSENPRLDRR